MFKSYRLLFKYINVERMTLLIVFKFRVEFYKDSNFNKSTFKKEFIKFILFFYNSKYKFILERIYRKNNYLI